jgi:transposase-like protein
MSKSKRAQYTPEFKIEAVRLVRGGHSTLDYVSPMQFEQRWLADQEKRAA